MASASEMQQINHPHPRAQFCLGIPGMSPSPRRSDIPLIPYDGCHPIQGVVECCFLGGETSNICSFSSRFLGKRSNLTHIFQMGWNHQLVFHGCFSCRNFLEFQCLCPKGTQSLIHGNVFFTINHTGIVQTKNGLPTRWANYATCPTEVKYRGSL